MCITSQQIWIASEDKGLSGSESCKPWKVPARSSFLDRDASFKIRRSLQIQPGNILALGGAMNVAKNVGAVEAHFLKVGTLGDDRASSVRTEKAGRAAILQKYYKWRKNNKSKQV